MTLIIPRDFIRNICGNSKMSDDIADKIVTYAQYNLSLIIEDAKRLMFQRRSLQLRVDDITNALKSRNLNIIFRHTFDDKTMYKESDGINSKPSSNIVDDSIIKLSDILDEPLPEYPQPIKLNMHWLAVDGVQPTIPENPKIIHDSILPNISIPGSTLHHKITSDMIEYFNKAIEILQTKSETQTNDSYESNLLTQILISLRNDKGHYNLTPYFITKFSNDIKSIVKGEIKQNCSIYLTNLLKAINCLINNKYINFGLYLHQVMLILLTLLIGKKLSNVLPNDQFSIRLQSSQLLKVIFKKYSNIHTTLMPRSIQSFHAVLDSLDSPGALYGSLLGYIQVGSSKINDIIPYIGKLANYIYTLKTGENYVQGSYCYQALLDAHALMDRLNRSKTPLFPSYELFLPADFETLQTNNIS